MNDLDEARRVLHIEAQSLLKMAEHLNSHFTQAVDMIIHCGGKVVVTGIGKSGIVGRKIASTLSSTGTPSIFLHPAESSHGDLGVLAKGDLVIAISYGGEAAELVPLLKYVARKNIPLIAMTGQQTSTLARSSQICLQVSITEEACPMGLAPTSSSTATLALGDALAMATLKRRGFRQEDFAEFHPAGSLGRRLTTRVRDVMHVGEALPLVSTHDSFSKVLTIMTSKEVRGVTGVIDTNGTLVGVITDGDIRRRLEQGQSLLTDSAQDIMSQSPKTIDCEELAEKALFLMQQFQIQILFAVDKNSERSSHPVGVLHLQDLLKIQVF
ncbi:MAG: KpsF/GutQ family sugar-phosphate isomerase [Bdellovibrionales bacterium]|nr:KpsF/GutQ family sugar-phosphate isomerase [Bdellovibrionales bacterium]